VKPWVQSPAWEKKKIKFLLHTALSDEGLSERIGDEKF
jgi:hypothetical protein